jgi:hypothetical protein
MELSVSTNKSIVCASGEESETPLEHDGVIKQSHLDGILAWAERHFLFLLF